MAELRQHRIAQMPRRHDRQMAELQTHRSQVSRGHDGQMAELQTHRLP
jgi:hypothetical protein